MPCFRHATSMQLAEVISVSSSLASSQLAPSLPQAEPYPWPCSSSLQSHGPLPPWALIAKVKIARLRLLPNFKSSGQGFPRFASTRATSLRVTLVRLAKLGHALDLRVKRSVACLASTATACLEVQLASRRRSKPIRSKPPRCKLPLAPTGLSVGRKEDR